MPMSLCRLAVPSCAAGEMFNPVNATCPRRPLPRVLDPGLGGLLDVLHHRPHHLIPAFRTERPGKEEPKLPPAPGASRRTCREPENNEKGIDVVHVLVQREDPTVDP